MLRSLLLVSALAAVTLGSPVAGRAANPTATIANGPIVGTALGLTNEPSNTALANAYLGVPFASSPPLRFAPPQPAKAWSSPLVAQALPPACPQQIAPATSVIFNNPGGPPLNESEDCLYLNVFAPQDASPSNLKPVLFWIFGGNLQFGSGSVAFYNGSSFAINEDVVVVTINYRTNMFGFSNSPEIPFGHQNSGFLDQRFALQWVQENIKAFGGDPSKVTIFGESAGGYSVKQLLANPPSPLPFRGAIMESQATGLPGNGTTSYENVVAHFNCTNATSQLACLRTVDAFAIRDYLISSNLYFPPVLNDGTYVASDSLPEIQSGKFAPVPILIGTNKDEGRVFVDLLGLDPANSGNESLVNEIIEDVTGIDVSSILQALLNGYDLDPNNDLYLALSQLITDIGFTCPTSTLSSTLVAAGRQPVWRYRFDGVFPNVSPFPNAGAFHSVEIPEVFGTYPLLNELGAATADQITLAKYMRKVWADFAKNPSAGAPWPKLGSKAGIELGILGGAQNKSAESTQSLLVADTPCILINGLLIADNAAW